MNLHKFCFDFVKKNPKWSLSNIILTIIYYPVEIIIISYLSGQIFSRINNLDKTFRSVSFLFLMIFIAYVIIESTIAIRDRVDLIYYPRMEREVRLGIVDIILKKMQINYDNIKHGEIIARLLKIPTFVTFYYERFNRWVVPFLVTFVIITIFFFFMNLKLGGISLLLFIIYLIIFYLIAQTDIKKSKARERQENIMFEDIDDTLNNCMSIITSGKLEDETNRLANNHTQYDILLKKQLKNSTLVRWGLSTLNIVVFSILTIVILYFYKKGILDNAKTITLITVIFFLIKHMRFITPRVSEIFVFYGQLKENNEFVQTLIDKTEQDGELTNFAINGEIEFKNVSFTYPTSNKSSLNNISFKIRPGEKVTIIGTSGSGKSSIIKLILGFYKPNQGTILINNRDILNINRKYLRNNISIVHQNVKLFNRTVIDNIAYGTNVDHEKIKKELQKLNIMKVFHNLPNGLMSIVGKYGDNLSGGQKQVIYLLRCYFRENPIIILDEPTSSIDVQHKEHILQMIKELSKKSTLIVVSHDPTIFNLFPRKIEINKGNLISDNSN